MTIATDSKKKLDQAKNNWIEIYYEIREDGKSFERFDRRATHIVFSDNSALVFDGVNIACGPVSPEEITSPRIVVKDLKLKLNDEEITNAETGEVLFNHYECEYSLLNLDGYEWPEIYDGKVKWESSEEIFTPVDFIREVLEIRESFEIVD
jgi:hypothetical protein